jgi:hypothetical protein
MDPVFLALLAKYGFETVLNIIQGWQRSGEPTPEQIREAYITKPPDEYFKPSHEGD